MSQSGCRSIDLPPLSLPAAAAHLRLLLQLDVRSLPARVSALLVLLDLRFGVRGGVGGGLLGRRVRAADGGRRGRLTVRRKRRLLGQLGGRRERQQSEGGVRARGRAEARERQREGKYRATKQESANQWELSINMCIKNVIWVC